MRAPRAKWLIVVLVLGIGLYFGRDVWSLWQFFAALDKQEAVAAARGPAVYELAQACTSCHGEDGSAHHPFYPSLAGLPADYLAAQLDAFADGTRREPMMAPLAIALSAEQRRALAGYFAALPVVPRDGFVPDAALAAKGKTLATVCANCHGVESLGGIGPRLAGQSRDYLRRQLLSFRSGARVEASGAMGPVTRNLDDEVIAALAEYFASL